VNTQTAPKQATAASVHIHSSSSLSDHPVI